MSKRMFNFMAILALLVFFSACDPDENQGKNTYNNGTYVTHEGPFQTGTGTISFISDEGVVNNRIFEAENAGQILGNILQSVYLYDEKAYCVVNNANKIVIVNKNSFKYISEIADLKQPQFAIAQGNKLYVSQWGIGGIGSGVAVVDLSTNDITKTILVDGGPQHMILHGGILYAGLSGGFGKDNRVAEIDINADTLITTRPTGDVPNQIQEVDGKLWLLCAGYYDFVNPDQTTKGGLYTLENDTWVKKIELENGSKSLVADQERKELYSVGATGFIRYSIANNTFQQLLPGYYYGLGFNVATKEIWVADAGNFASAGSVTVFNRQIDTVGHYPVDIIPNGFLFN